MEIDVITLWQPWASFIAEGWKTIETRTHYRFISLEGKTIGIHAGMKWDKDWEELAFPFMTEDQKKLSKEREQRYMSNRGKILCTASVRSCEELYLSHSRDALIDCHNVVRYGLILRDLKIIDPPIPAKGKQGIWKYNL